jgi:hypothetical protein
MVGASSFSEVNVRLLELPLILFAYFLAASAITLRVALYFSVSFSAASMCILGCLLLAAIALLPNAMTMWRSKRERSIDLRFLWAAFLVAIIGASLAASINRPDIDDSIYAPKALFYLAQPEHALDLTVTWLAALPGRVDALDLQYYETTQAAVARMLGLHFLSVYHIIFPAIAGFLMCLSMLLFLFMFDQRKWACICGVGFLLTILLALGETHMAFGNLSLARAFHAKYVFLSVMVPAWSYFSLQFLTLRSWTAWFALLAIGTGMVGATSTAMVFLPLLSFVLTATFILTSPSPFALAHAKTASLYVLALLPVFASALHFFIIAHDRVASGTPISAGYPLDFGGQLKFLINPDTPLTPVLFVASTIGLLCLSEYRRFFALWIGLPFALLLNTIVFGFVITYIAPETIYWRLFYLVPFPMIVGVVFIAFLRKSIWHGGIAALLIVLAGYAALLGETSVLRKENGARLDWPGYKIDEATLAVVSKIVAAVPRGSMLAPIEISSNVLIYSAAHPQFHMREDYLRFVLVEAGYEAEFTRRVRAFRYLYENRAAGRAAFEEMLSAKTKPELIVLDATALRGDVKAILDANEYRVRALDIGNYVLYERS